MRPRSAAEPVLRERAPAKLNLDLLVTGRRPDGYHELDSLVVFADPADELRFAPAPLLQLEVAGPFAAELPTGEANIVLRAARLLAERTGVEGNARIGLVKRLPVAAGIGGGSADAAATLRGLRRLWNLSLDDRTLAALGLALGADVPVCLAGTPSRMRGIGERLEPLPNLPALDLVLVNPRRPLATAAVFGALRLERPSERDEPSALPRTPEALVERLAGTRNDLEAPARTLLPAIGEVLAALVSDPACRLARMSGSGPTCFGIFPDAAAARTAAARLAAARPDWWVVACRSGGGA
ncbi:4-(cytidine 5'-diphospho)-2-C-methyl-D-erythritol kinase [Benzoatithermus flavus]|uniref:4-diphosphocytidyl-2-C-methyl-D-erythritol kinase n=1 Tax=Benzoatithermus flavus TaxID=3108223 RepID=A0ABU8XUG2_9PROT